MENQNKLLDDIKREIVHIERKLERHDFDKKELNLRSIEKKIDYLENDNHYVGDLRARFNTLVKNIGEI
jgi:hypothetical protein